MPEQDFRFRIQKSGPSRVHVYLEPWGESYELPPVSCCRWKLEARLAKRQMTRS